VIATAAAGGTKRRPLGANGGVVKDSTATWVWVAGHAAYGMVGGLLDALWR
jgi:hypothetical protein